MRHEGQPQTQTSKGFRIWGCIGVILGIYWDDRKENGNYDLKFQGLGLRAWGLGFRL